MSSGPQGPMLEEQRHVSDFSIQSTHRQTERSRNVLELNYSGLQVMMQLCNLNITNDGYEFSLSCGALI